MPITPGQAFLSLPAGLTEADYPTGSLLDYTPPDVRWQAPLASTGENIYANYVKAHPDLLREYNRRLARPLGATGALPSNKYGAPISMAEYGYGHWSSLGQGEGRTLTKAPGVWGDPGRSPYLPYYYPGEPIEIKEDFTEDGIDTIAKIAMEVNSTIENIGARRLHTIIEKILDDISFTATDRSGEKIVIDKKYVENNIGELVKDTDLSKFNL